MRHAATFGAYGDWSPTTMGDWSPTTMGDWNPAGMSGAYGSQALSPFPVRHPTWVLYGPARKIGILKGEIGRLQSMKKTRRRTARIVALREIKNKIEERNARGGADPAIDAEIAAMEADLASSPEPYVPMVPTAQPSGPPTVLILGGLALALGGAAYYFTRKK